MNVLGFRFAVKDFNPGGGGGSGSDWLSHEHLKVVDWSGRWTWRVCQVCIKSSLTCHTGIGLTNQRLLLLPSRNHRQPKHTKASCTVSLIIKEGILMDGWRSFSASDTSQCPTARAFFFPLDQYGYEI
jgi:hypothetical protein